MNRRISALFVASVSLLPAGAQQFSNLQFVATSDGECSVAKSPEATGKIVIPATAVIDDIERRVTSIDEGAFAGNSKIEGVEMSDNITTIGRCAFYDCPNLTTVVIGSSTAFIDTQSFDRCTGITRLNCRAQTPPQTGTYIFDASVYKKAAVTVPEHRRTSYMAVSPWNRFATIVENNFFGEDVLLTVVMPSGTITTEETFGSTVSLTLTPESGWKVSSVTFNGADITDSLGESNQLTTPALTADSRLNVIFSRYNSVPDVEADSVTVAADGPSLIVNSPSLVDVYDIGGSMIYHGAAGRTEIGCGRVVIVKTGGYTFKSAL